MSDVALRLAAINIYPVKSCAGVALDAGLLVETGLELDRAWMVVDAEGRFVTQRQLPRMALLRPTLKTYELVLRAPGMLALHLMIDAVEQPCRVRVWHDEVAAYDMGDLAAQWFTDFLRPSAGVAAPVPFPLRLVRFDPAHKRLSSRRWTGEIAAENAFSDGFPLLVTASASLGEVNRRLQAAGHAPVTMARFRPNLVLDGLVAHGEDHLDEIVFPPADDGVDGGVRLKLVKPCARCPIPDVDPETGQPGHAVMDTLSAYRADARLDGAITFAMNAVIVEGVERVLRVGMAGAADYKFE